MATQVKTTPLKRPLSFSDDCIEWDSVRDEIPADVGWNSMKNVGNDCGVAVSENGIPIEWTPYGYTRNRKAKKPRLDSTAAPPPKKQLTDTVSQLSDEDEKACAAAFVETISKHPGSFVFERSDKATYAHLVPFPSTLYPAKLSPADGWQLDKQDCKLESLVTKAPTKLAHNLTITPWRGAKRRELRYEAKNVKREARIEDTALEDGVFSWITFENAVKPKFIAMEPRLRCEAAKKFTEILKEDFLAVKTESTSG